MSPSFNKISNIVLFRQLVRRWRKKAAKSSVRMITGVPSDVPAGHLAVYVGDGRTRFVVRAAYLNHPIFQKLLLQAEEEFGFSNQGPLAVPCDESEFEQIVRLVSSGFDAARFDSVRDLLRVGCRNANLDFQGESRPLLGC